ncbi:MAG: hypothetical protein KDA51_06725, partial [Planctomycetales bacterium]|nr:hypothetical protein [Planctomycetales bacterium]
MLIKALQREATRLDNVDDLESLSAALLDDDNDFDLSRYWGYDTRPDAPAELKRQVATFEQIQGIYFERQAALALAEQEREKRRKGAILIGSIVALIAIISAWVHFVPNRFSIDIREHNLKKLKFLSDFSTLAGQPMADLAGALTPPPPRFVQIARTYNRLAKAPPTSLYAGQMGVWQILDDKGQLAQLMLTGVPDRVTLRRLYQAL